MQSRFSREQLTDVRGNTSHDDLLLAGILNRLAELRVIPSVNLALALDERRIRVHVKDRLGQRAVGSVLGRRREHNRKVEKLANAGVRDHGVVVQGCVEVSGDAVQAILQVEDEQQGVRLVQSLERHSCLN